MHKSPFSTIKTSGALVLGILLLAGCGGGAGGSSGAGAAAATGSASASTPAASSSSGSSTSQATTAGSTSSGGTSGTSGTSGGASGGASGGTSGGTSGSTSGSGSTPPTSSTPTTGNATVSWSAPTTNTDGSALTDLAGYHIYYGTSATALTRSVNISSTATTSYELQNLASGTWYFAVTAVTNTGTESAPSAVVSKTVT